MAIKSGYFNSVSGDRKYNAEDMTMYFKGLVSDGVYQTVGNMLAVTPGDGLTVNLDTGRALVNMHWIENDSMVNIDLGSASVSTEQYKLIILRCDLSENVRSVSVTVKDSSSGTVVLKNDENIKELCLARVRIRKNASTISQSDVRDYRGSTYCPWITGLIQQVDTSKLNEEFYAYYDEQTKTLDAWLNQQKKDFESWLSTLQSELKVNTKLKTYQYVFTTTEETTEIPLIEQYETGDSILIHIGGVLFVETNEFEIDTANRKIILKNPVMKGNTITQYLTKSTIGNGSSSGGGGGTYVHPTHTAYESGHYNITVDNLGHVTNCSAVTKSQLIQMGLVGGQFTPEIKASGTGSIRQYPVVLSDGNSDVGGAENILSVTVVNGNSPSVTLRLGKQKDAVPVTTGIVMQGGKQCTTTINTPIAPTANYHNNVYLPSGTGTLALLDDIPTAATESKDGLLTSEDKKKLDEIPSTYLPVAGGAMSGNIDTATNNTEIIVSADKSGVENLTVVAGGTVEASGSMTANLPNKKSFVGTYHDTTNDSWYNIVSVRHRNGYNDGNKSGMAIYSDMFETGKNRWDDNLKWNKQNADGTWQGVRTLLDTVNYSNQMAAELTTENLNNEVTNGICGLFYAAANNTCQNTAVPGDAFLLIAIRIAASAKTQVAIYPHNNAIYMRSWNGKTWTAWRQI